MKKALFTPLLLLLSHLVFSQEVRLSGKIYSSENERAIPFAAVSLLDSTRQHVLQFSYSDEQGEFELHFKKQVVYIVVQALGYKSYESEAIIRIDSLSETVIRLEENTVALDEVEISTRRKSIQMKEDKMIVDIEQAGIGDGNDALETLSKLPGMRQDKNEDIVFRGSSNLQILINGKPSFLQGDDLKQYLRTLNGNAIKTVEIIANPSAEYDAAGTAAVLNLVLKQAEVRGTIATGYASIGYAEFIKNREGLSLYSNNDQWNFNSSFSYSYTESVNHRKIIQEVDHAGQQEKLEQLNDWFPTGNYYSGRIGVARTLNKRASIGSSWNYNYYKGKEETEGRTLAYIDNNLERYSLLTINQGSSNHTLIGNAYYSFESDSADRKLDVQINYANYNNEEDRLTQNQYLNAYSNQAYQPQFMVKNSNPTRYSILSSRADYKRTFHENFNVKTGTKLSHVNNDYDINLQNQFDDDPFEYDVNRSNHLLYRETIGALYGLINFKSKQWNYQVGLRSEYIQYEAKSLTSNSKNTDEYLSFFPSFNLNGNFDKNQYKLAYSRRIDRPRYLQLNPFFEYIDTYNVSVGNPSLGPAFVHSIELTWVRDYNSALSIYSKHTNGEIYDIIDYNERTQITTTYLDNIARSVSVGLTFNTTLELKEWWEMEFNTEAEVNQVKSEVEGFSFDNRGSYWYTGIEHTFYLKNDWRLSCNGFYSSGDNYGNGETRPFYDLSFRLRKELLNKKLRLNFSAINVLKRSLYRGITIQDNVKTDWTNRWETRKFTLTVVYNWGQGKKKRVKEADLNDERNRL